MELPQEFLARMEKMLGGEYGDFLRAYEGPRQFGLRVNTLKISVEEFVKLVPFHLRKIPWTDNGFYYEREDDPARHPFYYAGLYYLQEPSAMLPAQILPVSPGERVLDLCAAPGGKATALAAKLRGRGLLVANEISASRARALLKNLEVFGVENSFVTNTTANRLAEQFPEFFDKILVDAPCSGEGMFRKDTANARAWSLDKVQACAKIQREITQYAVDMLRPGGLLLYSTCTFAPEEDEGTVAYLLSRCPELELLEIPGCEAFSRGRVEWLHMIGAEELCGTVRARRDKGVLSDKPGSADAPDVRRVRNETLQALRDAGVLRDKPGSTDMFLPDLSKCVRLFPHRCDGEGHFLALFRKKDSGANGISEPYGSVDEQNASRKNAVDGRKSSVRKQKKSSQSMGNAGRDEETAFQEFFQYISAPWDLSRIELRSGQAYYVPEAAAAGSMGAGFPFLRNGLYLGEIRRGRFEPSQSLAMALRAEDYASVIDFTQDDPRARRYLCGETVEVDDLAPQRSSGWQLVCVCGYSLGWGKLSNGTLKNKYHSGWRMQS